MTESVDQYKGVVGESETMVRCLKLRDAINYKNASTLCPDIDVDCSICPINIALNRNPKLTHSGLQSEVMKIGSK